MTVPVLIVPKTQGVQRPAVKTADSFYPLTGNELLPTQVFPRNRKRRKGFLVSTAPLFIGTYDQVLTAVTNYVQGLSNPNPLFSVTQGNEQAIASPAFSAPIGSLYLVRASFFSPSSAGATVFTIADTMGLVWTQITANNDGGSGGVGNMTIDSFFTAVSNGIAGTVTVTPSRTGAPNSGISLDGYSISGQSGIGTTGSATNGLTIPLAAPPAASSLVIVSHTGGLGSDPGVTTPPGMTPLIVDRRTGGFMYSSLAYKNGNASQNNTFGGNTGDDAGVAIEITKGVGSVSATGPLWPANTKLEYVSEQELWAMSPKAIPNTVQVIDGMYL